MTRLSVNIDHIATVRQARRAAEPDPVAAAVLCELAGAEGITVHLRGDRRHIQDRDVQRLRETVTTRLNIEMAATAEMLRIARQVRPDVVTLVPEKPGELTTSGGIDAARLAGRLRTHVKALKRSGIVVSLFIDPAERQVDAAAAIGAQIVELNTNAYSIARTGAAQARAYDELIVAACRADEQKLLVAAGHGLTARNVRPVADIPEVFELNIGHSIVARATLLGLQGAVQEMLAAMNGNRGQLP
jgi:pyridoxine 5-phosphate synthase